MPFYLAEWFRAQADQTQADQIIAAFDAATDCEAAVRLILILAVPTDQVIFGLFAAPSPRALLAACSRAGIPPQRLTSDVQPTHHATP
jgi:hypothetical protein